MKKIITMSLVILLSISLSGCKVSDPFSAPYNTTLVEQNYISFTYNDGITSTEVFHFTFSDSYAFFKGPIEGFYDFKAINNYKDISTDFKAFINEFEYITYERYENVIEKDYIQLSKGASEGDYNLANVYPDGKVYDVDAFMSDIDSGIRAIFSYTELYEDGQLIIIPAHISFVTYEIYQTEFIEYLIDNTIYDQSTMTYRYAFHLFPVLPKTGLVNYTLTDEKLDTIDPHTVIYASDNPSFSGSVVPCSETITTSCTTNLYSYQSGYVYDQTIQSFTAFYVDNFFAVATDDTIVFTYLGVTFTIEYASVILNIDGGSTENVIEMTITIN